LQLYRLVGYQHVCFFVFTFVGPCIVIYIYSKTNQMHNTSNLFYFGTTLYMFPAVSPSVIRSLWLLARMQPQILYDINT